MSEQKEMQWTQAIVAGKISMRLLGERSFFAFVLLTHMHSVITAHRYNNVKYIMEW